MALTPDELAAQITGTLVKIPKGTRIGGGWKSGKEGETGHYEHRVLTKDALVEVRLGSIQEMAIRAIRNRSKQSYDGVLLIKVVGAVESAIEKSESA
jgi:hypothetical protein